MKKITVLTICIFFSVASVFARENKQANNTQQSGQKAQTTANNTAPAQKKTPDSSPGVYAKSSKSGGNTGRAVKSAPAPRTSAETKQPAAVKRQTSNTSSPRTQKTAVNRSGSAAANKVVNTKQNNNNNNTSKTQAKTNSARNAGNENRRKSNNNTRSFTNRGNNKSNVNTVQNSNTSDSSSQGLKNYSGAKNRYYMDGTPKKYAARSSHRQHNKNLRPKRHYSYSHYYSFGRPSAFGAAINFLLFPFGYFGYYPYGYYYYGYPFYDYGYGYNYNTYNTYSYFTNEKLSADYTMLQKEDEYYEDGEEDFIYDDEDVFDISEIKTRNARLIRNNGNFIGFEIDNASGYHISAISFKITIRGMESAESRSGIFYKFEKPLSPGEKEFYIISLDDLDMEIPSSYTVFAEIESISTPSGDTVIKE